jgi:hypothetical protein
MKSIIYLDCIKSNKIIEKNSYLFIIPILKIVKKVIVNYDRADYHFQVINC